jgi:hypothetical protein
MKKCLTSHKGNANQNHVKISLSYGNSQDAPLLMNGLRKCGIYAQWNFTQPQRKMKFCSFFVR